MLSNTLPTAMLVVKKPSNDPAYDNVLLHHSIAVLVADFLYLAFSIEHSYNIIIIETLSRNVRHKVKVYAFG